MLNNDIIWKIDREHKFKYEIKTLLFYLYYSLVKKSLYRILYEVRLLQFIRRKN